MTDVAEEEDTNVYVEVDPDLVHELRLAKEAREEASARYDALRDQVVESLRMADGSWATRGVVDGQPFITHSVTTSNRLDTTRLREEWPQVYQDYVKPGSPVHRIKLVRSE